MMYDTKNNKENSASVSEKKTVFVLGAPINGTVHVNASRFCKKFEKMRIRKRHAIAGALVVSHLLAGVLAYNFGIHNQPVEAQPSIPSGYILTTTTESIEPGDTITKVASEFYDADTYSGIYDNVTEYTTAILEQNGLRPNTTIYPGDRITLPVVVNASNEHYVRMQVLESQIKEIEQNSLWIPYVVKFGDTYANLAARASGTDGEIVINTNRLIERNKDSGIMLMQGSTVWIMNPELGPLKIELNNERALFQESLKVEGNEEQIKNR